MGRLKVENILKRSKPMQSASICGFQTKAGINYQNLERQGKRWDYL